MRPSDYLLLLAGLCAPHREFGGREHRGRAGCPSSRRNPVTRFHSVRRRSAAFAILAVIGGCVGPERISLLERSDAEDVELLGDLRKSLAPAFPAELDFAVDVPPNPKLTFSVAVATQKRVERGRVDFRVRVVSEGFPVTVFRKSLRVEQHNRWYDATLDLAAWAGKRATLRFETFPTRGNRSAPWADRIRTLWGSPELASAEPVDPPKTSPPS